MKTSFSNRIINVVLSIIISTLCAATALAQSNRRGLSIGEKPAASSSSQRVALVIGNSAYTTAPLKNPVNDARAIAQALQELGFEVEYEENLSQNEMKRAIRAFGQKARSGGVRLFYYAGHGIQVNGENYLIPVNADFNNELEVEYETVNAGLVLAQLEEAEHSLNIIILDACRNNPLTRSFRSATRGLAAINAPSGTLIAYATAPGSVASDGEGSNGLYTQELLRYMRTPGLSVENIFKQVRISVRGKSAGKQTPWESSSLTADFFFSGANNAAATQREEPTRPATDSKAIELEFWDSIKNSSDPDDFREYLRKYPDGDFAGIANNRLKKLRASTAKSDELQTESSSFAGTVWQATVHGLDTYTHTLRFSSGGKLLWQVRAQNLTAGNKDAVGTWRQEGNVVHVDVPATPFNRKVTGVLSTIGNPIKGQIRTYENASSWNDQTLDLYREQ